MIINLNPKRLFLIDACGAVVSAITLGLVLTSLESLIGMPPEVLQTLAYIACFLFVYSFSCFMRMPENWRPFLKAIALANFTYCLLTITMVIKLYEALTIWGVTYFVMELMVILVLVVYEWKIADTAE